VCHEVHNLMEEVPPLSHTKDETTNNQPLLNGKLFGGERSWKRRSKSVMYVFNGDECK